MVPNYVENRFHMSLKRLMYLGAWPPEPFMKPSEKKIFYVCAFLRHLVLSPFMVLELIDLFLVSENLKKMIFNFSSSTISFGLFGKLALLYKRREILRRVLCNLWKDSIKYNNAEDAALFDKSLKKLKFISKILFVGPMIVLPIWGLTSYFSYKWGPRVFPFAIHVPAKDFDNDAIYLPVLIYQMISAFYISQTFLESDIIMLSVVSQIQVHCQILSRNLTKLSETLEEDDSQLENSRNKTEMHKYLSSNEIQRKLKSFVKRHLEILQYCEDVECIFNKSMAIQLLGGSFLILMISVETTMRVSDMNATSYCQLLYLIIVVIDIFLICYYFTSLATECTRVGHGAYGSRWYKMDPKIKRMLCLIIIRTQKPPKFTYGKLFVINIKAYMHLIKNIYSWLMLFRQLEMK